ncbi:Zn-dependent peptidase ImmA (M78 family) [Salibacterium salarium]|uniref:ImmA/IrrE family metallo-endopeptidase n=1 Tax=Salibacterium salarium TaxID=284579 RepID=UPI0027805501|nr:ImmA/IrrE family metallo-endopeptidase [Salibacterium salarium]MDQ0299688.1 Zn-dependent peptidase ImmA (M78 family) [Salibacterium salarium]
MLHTHREDYVLRLYDRLDIYHPKQIIEKNIARRLHIFLKYHDDGSTYKETGKFRAIILQRGLSPEEHRIQFFHELGHVLRHHGNRLFLPEGFADFLEWDSKLFELYASLPYHMLKNYDWDALDIIEQLSEDFVVPEDFVERRLRQLYKQTVIEPVTINKITNQLPTYSASYEPSKWSKETKRVMGQLQEQIGKEVINHVGLLRRD